VLVAKNSPRGWDARDRPATRPHVLTAAAINQRSGGMPAGRNTSSWLGNLALRGSVRPDEGRAAA
jgi:hypothetical protein